jgi:NhaP-type Na+/H+ or K+/H+ antiporter
VTPADWLTITAGLVFVSVTIAGSSIKRLPLNTAIVYLAVGWLVGPRWLNLLQIDLLKDASAVEHIALLVVITSLFTAGLKLRASWRDYRWRLALRLAFLSMALTVGLITCLGIFLLNLSIGAAVLLGAMLAGTDPVLASDVEVDHPFDPNPLRFSLTGEAGFNDGTVFPFVILGLGLLGNRHIGTVGWRWLLHDLLWGTLGALGIGLLLGGLIGTWVLHLRRVHHQALGYGFLLVPGLILLAYGLGELCGTFGFLAVFSSAIALLYLELQQRGADLPVEEQELAIAPSHRADLATAPETAQAYLAQGLLDFSEQLEQLGEAIIVTITRAILSSSHFPTGAAAWFLPLLFLVIRPIAVMIGLLGSSLRAPERALIAWFGIRGIGSIYYLAYLLNHGVTGDLAKTLIALTTVTVGLSAGLHGLSVTPLMNFYSRRYENKY